MEAQIIVSCENSFHRAALLGVIGGLLNQASFKNVQIKVMGVQQDSVLEALNSFKEFSEVLSSDTGLNIVLCEELPIAKNDRVKDMLEDLAASLKVAKSTGGFLQDVINNSATKLEQNQADSIMEKLGISSSLVESILDAARKEHATDVSIVDMTKTQIDNICAFAENKITEILKEKKAPVSVKIIFHKDPDGTSGTFGLVFASQPTSFDEYLATLEKTKESDKKVNEKSNENLN